MNNFLNISVQLFEEYLKHRDLFVNEYLHRNPKFWLISKTAVRQSTQKHSSQPKPQKWGLQRLNERRKMFNIFMKMNLKNKQS